MPQIHVNALQIGDIVFKQSNMALNFGTHSIIRLGQKLGMRSGGNSKIVHPAIFLENNDIAESVGGGLRRGTLDEITGVYKWQAFRHSTRADIAELAAQVAENLTQRSANDPGYGAYNKTTSALSAFRSSAMASDSSRAKSTNKVVNFFDRLEGGNHQSSRTFFCSNFVALAYSVASEILTQQPFYAIDLSYEHTSPAELYAFVENSVSWTHLGFLQA